jgi:hypothetical protein
MGFEGANVLFDTWVHPLMMGLEEHLLHMFRDDFEFHDGAAPSHLGRRGPPPQAEAAAMVHPRPRRSTATPIARPQRNQAAPRGRNCRTAPAPAPWAADAEKELQKIPFFVRGKARRNTERYAANAGVAPSPSRRSTMPKRTSAADLSQGPAGPAAAGKPCACVLVTMDSHLASAANAPTPSAGARAARPAAERCTPPTNGAATKRAGALPPTSPQATSSSSRCCSWKTTSCRCCRRCRRGASIATRWSAPCPPAK